MSIVDERRAELEEMSNNQLIEIIEQLSSNLRAAAENNQKLRQTISDHTKSAVSKIMDVHGKAQSRITMSPAQLKCDFMVKVEPILMNVTINQDMGGWSQEHKMAFRNQMVKAFSNHAADAITAAIWPPQQHGGAPLKVVK